MFDAIFGDLLPWGVVNLATLCLLLTAALWSRYTARRDNFLSQEKHENAKGVPSMFPYIFPLLGSLPITYLWKPKAFVLNQR